MTAPQAAQPAMLPLARIVAGYNPRRYFDAKSHKELVASMRQRGMLQPMLVRPAPAGDDTYLIVAGGRRYRAALEAFGADGAAPVVIREMTDQEALEAAIDENDVRDDASETEQADAAVRVLAACGNDRAEAARRLAWSPSKLERRLVLANLSDAVKTALDERRIKVGHAELLAAVPADKQDKALETILGSGLSVGKTRDLLMRLTQNLGAACFDKGECGACVFNSASQRALFEVHVEDGHCTNPECFQLKSDAAEQARQEEAVRQDEATRAVAASTSESPADNADAADNDLCEDVDEDGNEALPDDDAAEPAVHSPPITAAPRTTAAASGTSASASKTSVTAQSIAGRTKELREATWRTALARALAAEVTHAHTTILVAGLTGTLSQIKPHTLTARTALLIDEAFAARIYSDKIAQIRALSAAAGANALCAIAAAYAKDVLDFGHVRDLAQSFAVNLRDSWCVDQTFLEKYTKDELKFIAQECGFVSHVGTRAFAKRLNGKKADLIARMLNVIGFDWAGRLPGCMTLDGTYGPPPASAK